MIFLGCSDLIFAESSELKIYFVPFHLYAETSQVQFPSLSPAPETSTQAFSSDSILKTFAVLTEAPSRKMARRLLPSFSSSISQSNFPPENITTPYVVV